MQRREKILLGVLALGLIVWQGWPITYRILFSRIDERLSQLQTLDAQVEQKENDQLKVLRATSRLKDWRTASLPADPLVAQRLYQQWLTDLAQDVGFTEVTVTPGRRTAQGGIFTGVAVDIQAKAAYGQVAEFLRRFQQSGLLHRVQQLDVVRATDEDGVLEVSIGAQGLALASAAKRDSLFAATALAEAVAADAKQFKVERAAGFPSPPFQARLGDEIVTVTSAKDVVWTVKRAQNTTVAAAHAAETPLEVVLGGPVAERAPEAYKVLIATNPFRPYEPPEEHSPQLVLPQDPIVTRGSQLQVRALVDDYDPTAGEPVFALAEGAPAGMAIDARSGVITWTPAVDLALGAYEATITARQQGVSKPFTGTMRIDYREKNEPPTLEPIGSLAAYLGRTTEYTLKGTDPDGPAEDLRYSLGSGAPAGATIDSKTGALSLTPGTTATLGDFPMTVRVTDSGLPPQTAEQSVTVSVREDSALTTFLAASVAWGDRPQAWFYDRAKNRRMVVHVGTEFKVADVVGKVVEIETDHLVIAMNDAEHRLALGQSLRTLGTPEGEKVPAGAASTPLMPSPMPVTAVPATGSPVPSVPGSPAPAPGASIPFTGTGPLGPDGGQGGPPPSSGSGEGGPPAMGGPPATGWTPMLGGPAGGPFPAASDGGGMVTPPSGEEDTATPSPVGVMPMPAEGYSGPPSFVAPQEAEPAVEAEEEP